MGRGGGRDERERIDLGSLGYRIRIFFNNCFICMIFSFRGFFG